MGNKALSKLSSSEPYTEPVGPALRVNVARQAPGVPHRMQPVARGAVAVHDNTLRAGLWAACSKFVEIQWRRFGNAELAAVITPTHAVSNAVTAGSTISTMGVAVVDTLFENVFAEAKGKETWVGTAKRNVPGLALAVGVACLAPVAATDVAIGYTTYKVATKVRDFFAAFGKDSNARFFDYQQAYAQAKATMKQVQEAITKTVCKKRAA